MYNFYFDSWDYDYNIENETEQLEELAPGKTVFFISRTQDSPNLFHGNCEMINIISIMKHPIHASCIITSAKTI